MNKDSLQEKGDSGVIVKEDKDYDLEEISVLEDDLNYLRKRKNMCNKQLRDIKKDNLFGALWSAFIVAGEIFIVATFHSTVPAGVLAVGMGTFYGIAKVMAINCCGTYFSRRIKKRDIDEHIEKIEKMIPETEKELQKMKEKTKYRGDYKTNSYDNQIDHSQELLQDMPEKPLEEQDLKLTRKK